jgi:threonine aldolase
MTALDGRPVRVSGRASFPTRESIVIDLRSDTVTRPTVAMRDAMARAAVGDDVLGDDPTVIALQGRAADLLGKAEAVFVPSGTMANLCAIAAQTAPGDEIIAHEESHFYFYETGGFAAIAGCSVRLAAGRRGIFGPEEIEVLVRPSSIHFARSRLVVVENTHNRGGGAVWPVAGAESVTERARTLGLRCHLDGARLMNACVATGALPTDYTRHFDTVSMCFSKGLGAPVGSVVAGDAGTMQRVRTLRKRFGGAMRQSGIVAAAALHALEHHVERLAEDHENARVFAGGIREVSGIHLDLAEVETNMVFFEVDPSIGSAADHCKAAEQEGVRMLPVGPRRVRAVFHLDVTRAQAEEASAVIRRLTSERRAPESAGRG